MSCPVHDVWKLHKDCNCSPERKWVRKKMLQDTLETIANLNNKENVK